MAKSYFIRILLCVVIQSALIVSGSEIGTQIPTEISPAILSTSENSELSKLQNEYHKVLSGFDITLLQCDPIAENLVDKIATGLILASTNEKLSEVSQLVEELKNYKPELPQISSRCNYTLVAADNKDASSTVKPLQTANSGSKLEFNNILCWITFLGTAVLLAEQ